MIYFALNMLDYAKFAVIFAAAASMAVAAVRHCEWRGGLALLSSLFLAAAMNELKLIDFEPESKTAIPLEMYFTCFRRHKLTRKARRFLARLRAKYNIRDVTIRQLEEERRHAAAVV